MFRHSKGESGQKISRIHELRIISIGRAVVVRFDISNWSRWVRPGELAAGHERGLIVDGLDA